MNVAYDAELRRIARTLSEIAHTLESADGADERVQRALKLTRELIPYRRFALLKAFPGTAHALIVEPELPESERGPLLATLTRLFRLVAHAEEIGRSSDAHPHLTLPLMGLDEVIGLVRMEPFAEAPYDAQHLRLLSVIAAQLGAYLTMIMLREKDTRRTHELEMAHDFQQLLVGVVSHDLRTPLSVITTVASSLLRKAEDPAKAKVIERVLRSAQRANRIINDLLDVTHVRVTGEMSVSRKRIDLLALVKDVLEDLRLANRGREIQIAAPDDAILGEWDSDRLTQVVTNLTNNALQYGDERAPIFVNVDAGDNEVVLSIHNKGPAIPDDLLPVLFDPFKQGQRTQHRSVGGGLGLGLYIVDQIVRSHGGTVSARSTASDGTTFAVSLPRWVGAHRTHEQSHGENVRGPSEHLSAEVLTGASTTIMVVDDDADVRVGITELLQSRGFNVVAASNGAEALTLLRKGLRPSLILLDIRMPVMDGESFLDVCRNDPDLSSIPLFIISADTATAVKLIRCGASGFLEKPLEPENLFLAIEKFSD